MYFSYSIVACGLFIIPEFKGNFHGLSCFKGVIKRKVLYHISAIGCMSRPMDHMFLWLKSCCNPLQKITLCIAYALTKESYESFGMWVGRKCISCTLQSFFCSLYPSSRAIFTECHVPRVLSSVKSYIIFQPLDVCQYLWFMRCYG